MDEPQDQIHDVESQIEPEAFEPGPGEPWGGVAMTIGLILVVVFAVQNTEAVDVDFLWLSGSFPLSIIILTTAIVSGVVALAGAVFFRRRRHKRRVEKAQLRQLRE